MLLNKNIKIRINGKNIKYYENLGYAIPKKINKQGREVYDTDSFINVSVFDIQKQSSVKVEVMCDYCNEIFMQPLSHRYKYCENGLIKKDCCLKCKHLKTQESNLEKYGVENPMQVEEFKEKMKANNLEKYGVEYTLQVEEVKERRKNTNLDKYGVENPAQSEEVKEKMKATVVDKYGVENPAQSEEVKDKIKNTNLDKYGVQYVSQVEEFKDKIKNTNLDKYGVEYVLQSEEVKNKIKNTNLEKYGVENPAQNEEVRKKMAISYYLNGSQKCSKQQIYIYNIVGGELNYPIDNLNLDIAFPEDKIYIEYDGGGHDLSVKMGSSTEKEFKTKEIKRYKFLKSLGWKKIKIVSPKDYVLKEEELLMCVNNAKNELLNNEISHVTIIWDKNNCEDNLIKL